MCIDHMTTVSVSAPSGTGTPMGNMTTLESLKPCLRR